ncbi:hypothetical protein F383_35379 [Gossypium arboreum]|uniref:Uncharacterized protein n=1 Tax=Gossypium arboreum TaxID=29729 RepID=A0A0B0N7P0_GOSAR|nr:hypothetical protein F383_35379 [Gossypium arboreum]
MCSKYSRLLQRNRYPCFRLS